MSALNLSAQMLAILSVIQGFEFLSQRHSWSDEGPWAWRNIKNEFGHLKLVLYYPLCEKGFFILNCLRVATATGLIFNPNVWGLGLLLFTHVLTVVRWLGTYNGGSDYMNSILLLLTFIGMASPEKMGAICLWYITLQLCYSYFKAGWVKVKNEKWRNGQALSSFALSPIYERSRFLVWLFQSHGRRLFLSWAVILFELMYPFAIVHQYVALGFICVGFLFHLSNAYVFGLNRFIFAWAAAYPALYWCSLTLSN